MLCVYMYLTSLTDNTKMGKNDLRYQAGDLENKPRIRNISLAFFPPPLTGKWIDVNARC